VTDATCTTMTKAKGREARVADGAQAFIDAQVKELLKPLQRPDDVDLDGLPEEIVVQALRLLNADRQKALKHKLHKSVVEQAVVQLDILEAEQAAERERAAEQGVWTTDRPG
jgi:hypothetical protein